VPRVAACRGSTQVRGPEAAHSCTTQVGKDEQEWRWRLLDSLAPLIPAGPSIAKSYYGEFEPSGQPDRAARGRILFRRLAPADTKGPGFWSYGPSLPIIHEGSSRALLSNGTGAFSETSRLR
jgi:hypothetical protein